MIQQDEQARRVREVERKYCRMLKKLRRKERRGRKGGGKG